VDHVLNLHFTKLQVRTSGAIAATETNIPLMPTTRYCQTLTSPPRRPEQQRLMFDVLRAKTMQSHNHKQMKLHMNHMIMEVKSCSWPPALQELPLLRLPMINAATLATCLSTRRAARGFAMASHNNHNCY
jgi:hypothetical protein